MEIVSLPFCAGYKYIMHVKYIKGTIYESFHFIKYASLIARAEGICCLFCHLNFGHLVKANCIYRFFDVVLNTTHFYPSAILV